MKLKNRKTMKKKKERTKIKQTLYKYCKQKIFIGNKVIVETKAKIIPYQINMMIMPIYITLTTFLTVK